MTRIQKVSLNLFVINKVLGTIKTYLNGIDVFSMANQEIRQKAEANNNIFVDNNGKSASEIYLPDSFPYPSMQLIRQTHTDK